MRFDEDCVYLDAVRDILEHPVFRSMDGYFQHGRTTCLQHCVRVSYVSCCVCRWLGLDWRTAARAALLHDLFLYDWHTHGKLTGERFHGFTHPRTALNHAVYYFDLTKAEQNIILRHMWPLTLVPPAAPEGLVVCMADKYCSLEEVTENVWDWIKSKVGVQHELLG